MNTSPNCPRCDYDLSGETRRWEEQCSTRGQCPECGLEFAWADVLVPSRWRSVGFLEHATGLQQTLVCTCRTLWWLPVPWIFWSKVKLHHTINLRRAFLTLIVSILALVLLRAGFNAWSFSRFFSLPTIPFAGMTPKPPPTWAYFALALHPVAAPEPLMSWNIAPGRPIMTGWTLSIQRGWMYIVQLWLPVIAICWPFMFFALPITRRRAGLSWAHIRRATLYPFFVLLFIALIGVLESAGNAFLGTAPSWFTPNWSATRSSLRDIALWTVGITLTLFPFWLGAWWLSAIVRGWKVARGFWVWLLLQIAAALAATIVCCLVWIARTL